MAPVILALTVLILCGSAPGVPAADPDPAPRLTLLLWRGETEAEAGLRAGLAENGLADIPITVLDAAQDRARLAGHLSWIGRNNTDVLYTFGQTVTRAAARSFRDLPIVFNLVSNPAGAGLMASERGSGRNLAGVTHSVESSRQLLALGGLVRVRRLGVLYNPLESNSASFLEEMRRLCERARMDLEEEAAPAGRGDLLHFAERLARKRPDAVVLPSDSHVVSRAREVVALFNRAGIPTLGMLEPYLSAGALVGLVTGYRDCGVLAAGLVRRILDGADPGTLPLQRPKPRLVVNRDTARLLGVQPPASPGRPERRVLDIRVHE